MKHENSVSNRLRVDKDQITASKKKKKKLRKLKFRALVLCQSEGGDQQPRKNIREL